MNSKKYIESAKKTEPTTYGDAFGRLCSLQTMRILHATMGISTEANELLDALKKHIFYGKPLDLVNLLEEHGDVFWYCAILADAAGFTFEESMDKNIEKLRARYSDKFTEQRALNRDLKRERKILET